MNIILCEASELSSDHMIRLSGRRYEHIRNVLKCAVGDQVRVGIVDGAKGPAAENVVAL